MADTAYAPQSMDPSALSVGRTDQGEAMLSNGVRGGVHLTVCVPCYHDAADALIARLSRLPDAQKIALLLFDDGSDDPEMTKKLAGRIMRFPGPARLATAPTNGGRSHARNRLVALAQTDWVLLLDADMCPDMDVFISRYAHAIQMADAPALIAGGFSLTQVRATPQTALHAAQSAKSECLPARQRARAPGRYVFTSNILVHRKVLETVPFDDEFFGWGWEDVDWGLRVAKAFPVFHIENTATHLGLDSTDKLLAKFGTSGANFARLVKHHPAEARKMRIWQTANFLKSIPLRGLGKSLSKAAAKAGWLPMPLRLLGLKFYRAYCYGDHLA